MLSRHGTLVANTTKTEDFAVDQRSVEVINRSASGDIFFTVDGTEPAVGGTNTYVAPAASRSTAESSQYTTTVVKMISSATPAYSVVTV